MRGYGAITVLALVLAVSRSVSFVWMALAAARGLHNRMAPTILHAPMRFFEENPQGRLLNRFAADLDKVAGGGALRAGAAATNDASGVPCPILAVTKLDGDIAIAVDASSECCSGHQFNFANP